MPTGIYHTVGRGETLYRISRTYQVDERYLARINDIDDPTRLEAGRKIFIPGATKPLSVSPAQGAPKISRAAPPPAPRARPKSSPPSPSHPSKPPQAASSPKPQTASSPRPQAGTAAASKAGAISVPKVEKGKFVWPVQGKILKEFAPDGPKVCKGIEIAAAAGTPVLAAAAGKVTYSGDGIRGYGNLIILKHDDDFFTVYGFNQKNLVKPGAYVGKGDRIALAGEPPGGGPPRLHFEIRHGKTALNPIFHLP